MIRGALAVVVASLAATGLGAEYRLHPFASDRSVQASGDRSRYYFELPRGAATSGDGAFVLDYEASPALVGSTGSITILLNGQPVDSRSLNAASPQPIQWRIRLPQRYLKPGFNELAVATQSRAAGGACRDDDLGSWVRFRQSSYLALNVDAAASYPLKAYPFPFVNWLAQPVASTPIVAPAGASSDTLSAVLNLAAGWGKRLSDKPVSVRVVQQIPAGPSVRVGTPEEFGNVKLNAPIVVDGSSLWVTAQPAATLDASVKALNDPQITAQMSGFAALPGFSNAPSSGASLRGGVATFEEVGFPTSTLAGIGTQTTVMVFRRPVALPLGRGGKIRVRFRHAATLKKERSLLSVTINGQPVASMLLTPDNANDGELECIIPVEQADRDEWGVEISAHHELSEVACGGRYDDVAWTTILGTSEFELREGSLPSSPYLQGFPYLRDRTGKLPQQVKVSLGSRASEAALSLAATIAARAAQSNHGLTSWVASTGTQANDADLVIGLYSDAARLGSLASELPVAPSSSGVPKIAKGISILPALLDGATVIEAVEKKRGVTYVVLGASEAALNRLTNYLGGSNGASALRGQIAVLSKTGELFTFDTITDDQRRAAEAAEMLRYKPGMNVVMTITWVVVALALAFVLSKFVRKKKPQA